MDVINNEPASRYEIHIGDEVAFAQYKMRGDVIVFTHTEVPKHLEGQGLAGRLAAKALDDAREHHLKVVPRCPYFATYIQRHPQYADLVQP
ncbi:MAG: acetyltransferase [Gemmatimonadetes bacterium]|nr:acetyltransferase [Gemmatimonadota bacterium]